MTPMTPMTPDRRPLKEFVLAKINFEISKAPHEQTIRVDLHEFGDEVDLFIEICKDFEVAGWSCYIFRYLTLFARNKIILSKEPKPSLIWSIEDHKIVSSPLVYMRDTYTFLTEAEASKALTEWQEYMSAPTSQKQKSWFERLFS